MFGRGVKLEVAMKGWRKIRNRSRPALEVLQNKCNGSSIVQTDTSWNSSSDYEVEQAQTASCRDSDSLKVGSAARGFGPRSRLKLRLSSQNERAGFCAM